MNRILRIGYTLVLIFCIFSCESDDFCQKKVLTARLVVRFYNQNKPSQLKKVDKIAVIAKGKTEFLYTGETLDSIVLPLKIDQNETIYEIWKNFSGDSLEVASDDKNEIVFSYTPKEVFVSKACGYKVDFYNINARVSSENTWIKSVRVKQDKVQNENKAHIYIYH